MNRANPVTGLAESTRRRNPLPGGGSFRWRNWMAVVTWLLLIAPSPTTVRAAQGRSAADALLTDSIFMPSSFWYAPIPVDAPLHPNSAGFVEDFLRQKRTFYGTVSINTKAYASPVFIVDADIPGVRIVQWDCQKKGYLDKRLAQQWESVPMPPYAAPAEGTDAEMTIYQPSTDSMWEFWKLRKDGEQWSACWGGRMQNVSKSDGAWPYTYGTTATGLPFLGGQITAEELRRGEIRHAMGIALVQTEESKARSWPAKRSDGYNPKQAANRIPQGLRFRLDPTIDVESLNMHPVGKTIARAAQKYGFIVWDKAGAITLRAQNPMSYTALGLPNPYPELFAGVPAYRILDGFPWDKLQFMPKDYGKPLTAEKEHSNGHPSVGTRGPARPSR